LNTTNPDIVGVTESWLNSTISDSVIISDTNFSIFRKDRIDTRVGGGVCILVNNATVKTVPVQIPPRFDSLELVAVDIITGTSIFNYSLLTDLHAAQIMIQYLCHILLCFVNALNLLFQSTQLSFCVVILTFQKLTGRVVEMC
jgi:hypothetical protein